MEGLNRDAEEPISYPESQRSASMLTTEWTDEKHSLYLKSMEASFVDQLYSSMDLHGSHLQDDCSSDLKSSRQMHVSTRIPSGQFKVHRDGSWGRINFRRPESASNAVAASRDISANPWIRHFSSEGGRHQNVATQRLQGKTSSATSNWFRVSKPDLCCQDSAGSNTEVMDQNFVDDDIEKVVGSQECNINKMKTSVVASSSNDQVVPSRELSTTHDIGKLCPPLDK